MRRRALTLLVLGGAVVILAAVSIIVAWRPWASEPLDSSDASGETTMEFVTISELDQNRITSIELSGPSGVIELVRSGNAWKITKPAALEVKPGAVFDILYSLSSLSSERVVEDEGTALASYGLLPPAVTVTATLDTGKAYTLFLGDLTPAGDSYYLMAEGDPRVYTVREHHGVYFSYGIPELWTGSRIPVDGSDVMELQIVKQGETTLHINQTLDLYQDDVEFRGTTLSAVQPWASSPKPVDLNAISSFMMLLADLRADRAVDANPADTSKYGLAKPSYELFIRDGKGVTLHIMVGYQAGEQLYLQYSDDATVYAGDPSLVQLLEIDPFIFVNKYAAIMNLKRVDTLSFSSGAWTHVLEVKRKTPGSEEGAEWLVDGRAVDVQRFKDFFIFAISLQIDSFHEDTVDGPAEVTLSYGLNEGPVPVFDVEFVPHSQEFYAVRKNGRSDILVNRQQVAALLQELEELVEAAVG